jgi:hypothetical protein
VPDAACDVTFFAYQQAILTPSLLVNVITDGASGTQSVIGRLSVKDYDPYAAAVSAGGRQHNLGTLPVEC